MNIIYIAYWGVNDGLTKSTVYPHLKILERFTEIDKIFFLTFERNDFIFNLDFKKVIHIPIIEKSSPKGLNKFIAFKNGRKILKNIIQNETISLTICRSNLAGILGLYCYNLSKIPFVIESYEPHLDYMIESGEWKKNSLKSKLLKKYDKEIQKKSFKLYPVAHNYKNRLIKEGISVEKIEVIPCSVDLKKFDFNQDDRNYIRQNLKIDNQKKVGVYVGKFGGIYLESDAFELFYELFKLLNEDLEIIILSPIPKEKIDKNLKKYNIQLDKVHILSVNHDEVPKYLSASDFAFSLQKPSPSNAYLNPIKIGEYWASGLPVFITKGVGDDDKIITQNNIGFSWDILNNDAQFFANRIRDFINQYKVSTDFDIRKQIREYAIKYRNFEINQMHIQNYSEIIENN